MRYEDIWPHVVDGYRVTCDRFGPGTFVDYQFAGLRINHAGGSSSGFTPRDEDIAAEWSLVPDEPKPTPAAPPKPVDDVLVLDGGKWGKPAPAPPNVGKWGKPVPKKDAWGKPA